MPPDVQAYFDAVPPARLPRLQALHVLILECFPEAMVDLSYKMPTYRYGDGWVAIANQKSYVSLYTCSAEHLAQFKQQYPTYKTGKGCINFRAKDDLPAAAIKQVIQHAMLHPKGTG